ncbi:hypothetical protein NPIL_471771, partial [Nephila pilipes]
MALSAACCAGENARRSCKMKTATNGSSGSSRYAARCLQAYAAAWRAKRKAALKLPLRLPRLACME